MVKAAVKTVNPIMMPSAPRATVVNSSVAIAVLCRLRKVVRCLSKDQFDS